MTDQELWAAVQAELEQTTISGKKWVAQGRTPGHWANAYAIGSQIGQTPVIPPAPPTSNPIQYVLTGKPGSLDTAGRDVILSGTANQQLHAITGENPVVLMKNVGVLILNDVKIIHDADYQSATVGTEYGYGLHLKNVGRVYGKATISGPTLSQGIAIDGVGPVELISSLSDAMHPVWHLNAGSPAEVHTDSLQSWNGPTLLGLYDTTLSGCGTMIQVQPAQFGGEKIMLPWVYRNLQLIQRVNPKSDQMPYMVDKVLNNGKTWPTDSHNVTYHALGVPMGVAWQGNDPAAYAPGGTWQNTGETWVAV